MRNDKINQTYPFVPLEEIILKMLLQILGYYFKTSRLTAKIRKTK